MIDPQIIRAIHHLKPELRTKFGVNKIGCFDCYLDSNHHHSDINVLVELEQPLGWRFFALKEFLEQKLEMHIDIMTQKSLKPALREEILSKTSFA